MKTAKLLTVAALGLALTTSTVPLAAAAAAPRAAAPAAVVVVTGANGGGGVSAHTGDLVQVDLTAVRDSTVTWFWSVPATTAPSVLSQTSGSSSPDGDARATFVALAPGSSTVTAVGRSVADRGYACPPFVVQWTTTVVVS